ncbi:LXG domain-containing protein [Halobacillus naozhouensis]|uniref:LXG domain-containing protein n=1 Tax=Halobacillus naozhouensis TaxID=554880 RepID=A0ABY8IYD1_9BACI|nr:LXG domain-containing protein [Halobacillus naozhouensis]WFT74806.1 LXG domain-containing protein [Halobacillus naozhouensis]
MKVLNVSEVIQGLEQVIQKKEQEKEQVLTLRDEMNKIIDLGDALKGEGGEAIKEHFITLHFPAIILFNQFLHQYTDVLRKIQSSIREYESHDGLIREDFIEQDVEHGLNKLENMTHDIVHDIRNHYEAVGDLIDPISLSTPRLDQAIYRAKRQNEETVTELRNLDEASSSKLGSPEQSIEQINQFISNIKSWTTNGVFLTEAQINQVENYFGESNTIQDMIDNAMKLSVEQGDSTLKGDVAQWLSDLGRTNGAYNVAKGIVAASVLSSGMLKLTKDGKGNFIVTASSAWKQDINKKYGSNLASNLHKLLKTGNKSANPVLKKYLGKYNNAPSGVLREMVNLEGGTTRISFGKVANKYTNVLVLEEDMLKKYKWDVDMKATAKQFSDAKSISKFTKRIPYVGIGFSVMTNSGEFYSDTNKHKSGLEKTGRFAAGLGLDVGVAGLTTGGAVIGTMICPGVGTIIGGAVGAGVGIVGSWIVEDTVKEWGEDAGKWLDEQVEGAIEWGEETGEKLGEEIDDLISGSGKFISNFFN